LWSIDIVGNLTPAQGNYTFVIVVVEYFTKWGRGEASDEHKLYINQKILLAKYHLPL
jgi:hypothetical protein